MAGELSIRIEVETNLADAADPVPRIYIYNDSNRSIEFQAFHGVPFSTLDKREGDDFGTGGSGRCGNGYAPRRLAPGQYESFPLWANLHGGPGQSGVYRVTLPYETRTRAGKRVAKEVRSEAFAIDYGDVEPAAWDSKATALAPVLIAFSSKAVNKSGASSLSATSLAKHFLPGINACVATARKSKPWIRGRFTLAAYKYPGKEAPVTHLGDSLLGDAKLNACLGALPAPADLLGNFELRFALPFPI